MAGLCPTDGGSKDVIEPRCPRNEVTGVPAHPPELASVSERRGKLARLSVYAIKIDPKTFVHISPFLVAILS